MKKYIYNPFFAVTLLLLVSSFPLGLQGQNLKPSVPPRPPSPAAYEMMVEQYMKSKSPTSAMPPLKSIDDLILFQQVYQSKASNVVTRSKDASDLASKIAAHYDHFTPTLFEQGASKIVKKIVAQTSPQGPEDILKGKELCFFLPQDKVRFGLSGSLYWNDQWKAVMIQIMEWPETVFAGLLMHELGHGYHSEVLHSKSAHAPILSDEWTEEEIGMHELEAAVFNQLSKGRYYNLIDRAVAKGSGNKLETVLTGVNLDILDKLDDCLGGKDISRELASLVCAEHLSIICFRYADAHSLGMAAKIEMYKSLVEASR